MQVPSTAEVAMCTQDSSNTSCASTRKYRYVSELDRLRMLRNLYKKETQKTCDEKVTAKLQLEMREARRKVQKTELMLKYDQSILQQLDQQRQSVADNLGETVKTIRNLVDKRAQPHKNMQELHVAESYVKTLLGELKAN